MIVSYYPQYDPVYLERLTKVTIDPSHGIAVFLRE